MTFTKVGQEWFRRQQVKFYRGTSATLAGLYGREKFTNDQKEIDERSDVLNKEYTDAYIRSGKTMNEFSADFIREKANKRAYIEKAGFIHKINKSLQDKIDEISKQSPNQAAINAEIEVINSKYTPEDKKILKELREELNLEPTYGKFVPKSDNEVEDLRKVIEKSIAEYEKTKSEAGYISEIDSKDSGSSGESSE